VIRHHLHDVENKEEERPESQYDVSELNPTADHTIFSFVEDEKPEKKPAVKVHTLDSLKDTSPQKDNELPLSEEEKSVEAKSLLSSNQKVEQIGNKTESNIDIKEHRKTDEIVKAVDVEQKIPVDELDRNSMIRQSRLKAMSMKLHSVQGLEELERQPAYLRRGTKLQDDTAENPDKEVSRYALNSDGKQSGLTTGNSFLHDNVD